MFRYPRDLARRGTDKIDKLHCRAEGIFRAFVEVTMLLVRVYGTMRTAIGALRTH